MFNYFLSAFESDSKKEKNQNNSGFLANGTLKNISALSPEETLIYSTLYKEGSLTLSSLVINVELDTDVIRNTLEELVQKSLVKENELTMKNTKEIIFSTR